LAVEDIGNLWNTKQPGYDDTADIQAALKAFLYGSYTYNPTNTDPTQLPNPSLARHLQGLSDRLTDQEELGIGSDYLTLAQIGALTGVADGYIAMASDSNGGAVESLYASAFYTNEAPTTDIVDGVLWVDKDSTALDTYVYDSTLLPGDPWVRINDLKNIVAAKGDLLVGTASEGLDNLTVGANGTVLTADDTQALGVKWQAPSVYSQPTLGTTAIASGATVTNVNDLTINSTTIPTSKTLVATDSTAYVIPSMSGNSGKYLTNDGSTPSWVTAPTSGGMTLIATATPNAATTVSFTSIPTTYKTLLLVWTNVYQSIQGNYFGVRLNNDSTSLYQYAGPYVTSTGTFSHAQESATRFGADAAYAPIPSTNTSDTEYTKTAHGYMYIFNADQTGFKNAFWTSSGESTSPAYTGPIAMNGIYRGTSAVSRIDFIRGSNQTITGTIRLYGVA
jgi:hypothetical protein